MTEDIVVSNSTKCILTCQ